MFGPEAMKLVCSLHYTIHWVLLIFSGSRRSFLKCSVVISCSLKCLWFVHWWQTIEITQQISIEGIIELLSRFLNYHSFLSCNFLIIFRLVSEHFTQEWKYLEKKSLTVLIVCFFFFIFVLIVFFIWQSESPLTVIFQVIILYCFFYCVFFYLTKWKPCLLWVLDYFLFNRVIASNHLFLLMFVVGIFICQPRDAGDFFYRETIPYGYTTMTERELKNFLVSIMYVSICFLVFFFFLFSLIFQYNVLWSFCFFIS